MSGEFLFLGTGGSMGVPVMGCRCPVCRSDNPKNKRTRSGGLLRGNGVTILIDASQDIRDQALRYSVMGIDAALITHAHHDHVAGIDDLRAFFFEKKEPIPCYMSQETLADLKIRYPYIFQPKGEPSTLLPKFTLHILEGERGDVEIAGIPLRYFSFTQVGMKVTGFRVGNLAYLSDIKEYPDSIFFDIAGVDTLIISALRYDTSSIHFSVDEAIEFARRVEADNTYLTHISHDIEHKRGEEDLPQGIQIAYDGLKVRWN